MKKYLLAIIISFITFSCNQLPSDSTPPPVESEVFKSNQLSLVANKQDAELNVPINITAKCFPYYSGNGVIKLSLLGGGRTVLVSSPVNDTLGPGDYHTNIYPVNFIANEDCIHNWTIILKDPPGTGFAFEAFIQIDSIMIDGKLFAISSEEAKNYAPVGQSYHSMISSKDVLVIH
jgi:hypothetical protein